jgi:hypothetical protein
MNKRIIKRILVVDDESSLTNMSGNAVGKRFLNTTRIFGVRAALQKPFMIQELKETIYRVNNEL